MSDSLVMLEQMTTAEKRRVFAAIARELSATDSAPIPVQDEGDYIGTFYPCGKARIVPPDEHSPYLDEIRERAKTAHQNISIEEFLRRVDEMDEADGRP